MISFAGKAILLDIEGTTSSVAFVYDVLFPFARRHLRAYVESHWNDDAMRAAAKRIAQDAGGAVVVEPEAIIAEATRLMDADVKATGLKQLQGLVWQSGYDSGQLRSHVYPDVPPALRRFNDAGWDVRIYSSGSVAAQKLFFAHTEAGDLTPLLSGHYDTTTGPKREADSYRAIAADFGLPAHAILFVSDIVEELDAAREVGLQTALSLRPGNAPVEDANRHAAIRSFDSIKVSGTERQVAKRPRRQNQDNKPLSTDG